MSVHAAKRILIVGEEGGQQLHAQTGAMHREVVAPLVGLQCEVEEEVRRMVPARTRAQRVVTPCDQDAVDHVESSLQLLVLQVIQQRHHARPCRL
eukprot:CAMPEP_0202923360 /NCGR_PEP_ID=MMETSP1392-20130828/78409_1 /ASSEMBLY_ACC=CAM_ASM_000868 /TAXON_ID=225041 /ORGANISM="Chlamydomonas chlamydogama, Strain SAG 11-48b" /LENGTH=94 /DNA_ID=CAMNT_0049617037 /DNA_START=902 /DNA_END=1186 /DNA_ORIENTATION=+